MQTSKCRPTNRKSIPDATLNKIKWPVEFWGCYNITENHSTSKIKRGPLRESRGIALPFFVNLGTLDGGGWSTPRPGRFYPVKNPVPIAQEAGWGSQPVWIGAENLATSGIRSPDLPAFSESLYRLRHPGSQNHRTKTTKSRVRIRLKGENTLHLTV